MITDEARRYLDEGMTAVKQGKYTEAIQAWSQALEIAPDYPQAQTNRGIARDTIGDSQGALADFNAVIALYPEHVDAYLNRANTYLKLQKADEALADLATVLRLEPNAPDAHFNRGNTLVQIHRNNPKFYDMLAHTPPNYETALADFDRAIELNPSFAEAYSNRAGLNFGVLSRMPPPYRPDIPEMYRKKEYSQESRETLVNAILRDINTALKLRPNAPDDLKNRGVLHLMATGLLDEALQDFTRALELDPQYLEALIFRCRVFNRMGRYNEAIQDATHAIELNPRDPNLYFNRAINCRLNGNLDKAVADLTHVINIDPNYISAYPNRAEIYTAVKDKKAAIADWEKYLALGGGRKFGDEQAVQDKIKKLKSFF